MLSGTTHILVISGSQFNIVAGILVSIGLWLFGKRRYLYIWLAPAAIWVYALLTGMSPPVIRAAIMVSLFLTADLLGRQKRAITVLAFAAAVMVAITPPTPKRCLIPVDLFSDAGDGLHCSAIAISGQKSCRRYHR